MKPTEILPKPPQNPVEQDNGSAAERKPVSATPFHRNAHAFSPVQNILWVEGPTDREFADTICRKNDVRCKVIAVEAPNDIAFRQSSSPHQQISSNRFFSHKRCVINSLARSIDYGMIDRDFDAPEKYQNEPKLFVTDTHDIETLMLSTDDNVLERLGIDCKLFKRALFMAYQFGTVRRYLEQAYRNSRKNDPPNRYSNQEATDFREFIHKIGPDDFRSLFLERTYKLSLEKLADVVSEKIAYKFERQSGTPPRIETFKKDLDYVMMCSDHFDKETRCWKEGIRKFVCTDEVWAVANGHDILRMLCSLDNKIKREYCKDRFGDFDFSVSNKKFEFALIQNYDYTCLAKTNMYNAMMQALKKPAA